MKKIYRRIKDSFTLLFSKNYTLVVSKNDSLLVCMSCCLNCTYNDLEGALDVIEELHDDFEQSDAVDLANRIINNKN